MTTDTVNINMFLQNAAKAVIHHYSEDLTQDLESMKRWFSHDHKDCYFYVMLRECGSYAFRIRDVFLKDTPSNVIWTAYADPVYKSTSPVKAYAVKVEKIWGGHLFGTIKQLSYEKSVDDILKHAVAPGGKYVQLSDGTKMPCSQHCPCEESPECPIFTKRKDNVSAIRFISLPVESMAIQYEDVVRARERAIVPAKM